MKKGMEKELLIGLIILLATILILGPTIKSWADTIKYGADKEACKQSVQLKASMKIAEKDIFNIPLKCSSKYRFIKNEKDFEKAKETIAYDMYDCWDQFGQGKIDFLEGRDFSENTYCFICSKIIFNETLKEKKIIGFGDHLIKENILGLDITYADFLFPKGLQDTTLINTIDTTNPLYLIYRVDRMTYLNKIWASVAGGGVIVACAMLLPTGVGTLPGIGCLVAAIGVGYVGGTATSKTYFYPSLLLTNSKEAIKICQEK